MGPPKVATHGTVPRRVDLHHNSGDYGKCATPTAHRRGPMVRASNPSLARTALAALTEAQEEAAVAEAALAEQDEEYGGALHV